MNMTCTKTGAVMRDGDNVLSIYDSDERLVVIYGSENGGAGRVFCGPKRFSEALQVFRSDFAQEAIDVYLWETRDESRRAWCSDQSCGATDCTTCYWGGS